jgi:ribosomal protein S6--L-glutamate ligase
MKILILSRNKNLYSTKRLVEESDKKGHKTLVIDYMHCNIINEKNNPIVEYQEDPLTQIDAIIPRIGSTFTAYGASIIRQFELQSIYSVVNSNALIMARDKLHCLQKLTRVNVDIPKTYFTHYLYNFEKIINTVGGYPFIIKQLEGTQGYGVFLIKDKEYANEIIKTHQSANKKIIFQEFIEESKGADIRAIVIGNKVVAAMKRQAKSGEFRSNLHQGGKGLNIELSSEETNAAINAAKAMGLGVTGVDMLQSKRGPLIIEVNASPGLEGIEKTTKINIAKEIIKHIENEHENCRG